MLFNGESSMTERPKDIVNQNPLWLHRQLIRDMKVIPGLASRYPSFNLAHKRLWLAKGLFKFFGQDRSPRYMLTWLVLCYSLFQKITLPQGKNYDDFD